MNDLLVPMAVDESLALDCAKIIQDDLVKLLLRDDMNGRGLFQFLNLIGQTINTNWIRESGAYYLTGQVLGMKSEESKSSKLLNMIYECSRKHISSDFRDVELTSNVTEILTSTYGGVYSLGEGGPLLLGKLSEFGEEIAFAVQSLNWLLYRTMYYSLAARAHNASLVLHPIRSLFSASKILPQMEMPPALCKSVVDLLAREGAATSKTIRSNTEPALVDLNLPLFSAWIASKSDGPANFIKTMLSLRSEKPFVKVRDLFRSMNGTPAEVRASLERNNSLIRRAESASAELLEKYGVLTPQGVQISKAINLVN